MMSKKLLCFDGGDYDLLLQVQNDHERSFTERFDAEFILPSGELDYNAASARQIVMLRNTLLGSAQIEGILAQISDEIDTAKLDYPAMETLRWLAEAIEKQWSSGDLCQREGKQ